MLRTPYFVTLAVLWPLTASTVVPFRRARSQVLKPLPSLAEHTLGTAHSLCMRARHTGKGWERARAKVRGNEQPRVKARSPE